MKQEKLLLLRKFKFREADLMIHAINAQGSKLHLIARGALRSKKRFAGGVLEPTHYVLAQYQAQPKSSEGIFQLQEASLIDDFPAIKTDYNRLQLALHLVQRIDQMSQQGEEDASNLFHLLGNALKTIGSCCQLEILRLQFECKLLNYQGVLSPTTEMMPLLKAPLDAVDGINLSDLQIREITQHLRRTFENYTQKPFEV